jgi:transposase
MFFVIDIESRIRSDHPLRPLKRMIDEEPARTSALFDAAYASTGRPGVPPERLLKALLPQAIYSVRGETQLIERIDTDPLFRGFLDTDPRKTPSTRPPSRTTARVWRSTALWPRSSTAS